jgi:hypothetical protein
MGKGPYVNKKTHYFHIFGKKWKITFHHPKAYLKISTDSKGLTHPDLRRVDIDLEHLSEELLRHELTHCYTKEMSLVELQLKKDQQEEFYCEMNGKHAPILCKQAKALYQFARKLKWKKGS